MRGKVIEFKVPQEAWSDEKVEKAVEVLVDLVSRGAEGQEEVCRRVAKVGLTLLEVAKRLRPGGKGMPL